MWLKEHLMSLGVVVDKNNNNNNTLLSLQTLTGKEIEIDIEPTDKVLPLFLARFNV